MSILSKRNNIDSPLNSHLEAESELCSNLQSFEVCFVKDQCNRYSLDTHDTIINDSINRSFDSSLELIFENTENVGANIVRDRQRQRIFTSSENSPEPRNQSVSPEITYSGTPVTYKLHETKEEFLIIKVPMSKLQARRKKCSDLEIVDLLDSESEPEEIFSHLQRFGAQVVGSLPRDFKSSETPVTPKKLPKRESRATDSESKENSLENTPSKKKLHESEEVSLRIKLRRSTEQSNYKIATDSTFSLAENGERTCRSSRRLTISTPKKCDCDCDENHSMQKRTRVTPKRSVVSRNSATRTPIVGRTNKNSSMINDTCDTIFENSRAEIRANESDSDSNDDIDGVVTRRRSARTLPKRDMETPQKRIKKLDETSTPRSVRPRRNSRLVNYNYNAIETLGDKENKSENDIDEDSDNVGSRRRGRSKLIKPISGTPEKQMKILEEPSTPTRTPRRGVVKKLAEVTPKRTPRRSAMRKIDEPITPTTTGKKISRVTTPSMKNACLTPSMSRRTANVGKPITILEDARAKLHVSAVPKSLPCREEEFNDIYQFLERKLLDNNGGCIYISGVPGTGKTATVNEVIRCLKKLVIKGDMDNFDFIEINGMKLSEPRQAYVQILKQINGQAATWEQAYRILEKRFTQSSAKRPMTLLLVDELDLLCNKRQDVVYNLLDWPAKENAQLVVITIANTMDLPERVLMGRVTSRLGLTRLTFQPYNHKQLQEIVTARLKDSDAFKSEAIQLVARKVAAVSGDARRALDICRRATEIAESNDGKMVTMQDVNQALTEMIASAKVQAIKHCSEMERMFLQAVCAEVARTGVEETSFHNVYRQLESLCSFEGIKIPNVTQTLGICGRLGANRLLLCEHSRTDTQQRILLNVSSDDIHYATQTIGDA